MVLNPDKCSFMLFRVKDELQTDLVSHNVCSNNSKEKKHWESLLITDLTFLRVLLALPKRRIWVKDFKNGPSQIWKTAINHIDSISLQIFKHNIKTWYSCLCYCCNPYIHHLGFI